MPTTLKISTNRLNMARPASLALIIGPQVRHFQAMQGKRSFPRHARVRKTGFHF
jgi:hypothetical protein